MPRPASPKLYHIVHWDRLPSIIHDGFLFADAVMRQLPEERGTAVGMSTIKQRRLTSELECQPGLMVGACVPFYYCPRSVMLYLLHMGNHVDVTYKGGQRPIVHLVFDLQSVVEWAGTGGTRWAITLSNAGSSFFESRNELSGLDELNWDAIGNSDFRDRDVKEGKQAEFLVERQVPWTLVERIGVIDARTQGAVQRILTSCEHRPQVDIEQDWYY